MKMSVIINNYNYAQFLGSCIDSALEQDYPNVEVLVVDDGSTDGSRDVIKSYENRIVAILKDNGGQASAFNAGFAKSSGDIVLFLDADDAYLPGKLSKVAELYKLNDIDWCFDRVTTVETEDAKSQQRYSLVDKRRELAGGKFPSLPVPTSGLTFRRSLLANILPMPVADDVVLSDNYLKFAAAYLGKGIVVDTPMTFQRLHDTNRYTTHNRSRQDQLRARIMVETGFQLAKNFAALRRIGFKLVAGGLARSDISLSKIKAEICRCSAGGVFGHFAAVRLAVLVLAKRTFRQLQSAG